VRAYSETGFSRDRPVHAAARREHEAPHAVEVARLGEDLGTRVVQIDGLFRVEIAGRVSHDRGERDDPVDVAYGAADIPAVANVALNDLEVRMAESLNADPTIVEPIENAHMVAALQQHTDQMRPNVSGAAGD